MIALLPERPEDRRVIIALDEAAYHRCEYDDGAGHELLRAPHTWATPVPLPSLTRDHPVVQGLLEQGRLNAGDVLLQSPFRFDDYEPAHTYAEEIAQHKHVLFSELCRRLGARKITISVVTRESDEGSVSVDLSANKKLVKGSAKGARERVESFASKLEMQDDFEPLVDIDAARQLLADNHLQSEPAFGNLLQARSGSGGTLLRRSYTMEATREASTRLSLLAKIKMPMFVGAEGDFQKLSRQKESYRLTYVVDF